MTLLISAVLIVMSAVVQVTWAARLEVAGAFPNLVLLGVVAVTWTRGVRAGFLWACAGGLLLDLCAEGAIGPHALALLPAVYLIGLWARNAQSLTALGAAVSVAAATVIYSLVLLLVAAAHHSNLPAPDVAVQLCIAAAVYNVLLAPAAVGIARKLGPAAAGAPDAA